MDKQKHYPDEEFIRLLTAMSVSDLSAIPLMADWIEVNHPEDDRAPYIRKCIGKHAHHWEGDKYRLHDCLSALHMFACHPCLLCKGNQWPKIEPKVGCRQCDGTGWYHEVHLPEGCGFTIGQAPGLTVKKMQCSFHICERAESQNAGRSARESFRENFPNLLGK